MRKTLLTLTLFALAAPAFAQDQHAGHGTATSAPDSVATLPEICLTAPAMEMAPMMGHEMDPARADLMAGMDENNRLMMQAGMADDLDIAFVCAMIPHHQGAINMARAELTHGDDQWARDFAQKIIDAQETEIAEMLAWLKTQAAAQ